MISTSKPRAYLHPPIEEALVDFRFRPGPEWDLTVPGKLHAHADMAATYPGKPRQQLLYETEVHAHPTQRPNVEVRQSFGRVQLPSADGRRLVTLAPDALSVNVLRPYDGWAEFRPRVLAALSAYWEVAEPQAVVRVGVRYINRIVARGPRVAPHDLLTCAPPRVVGLPDRMDEFMSRIVYDYGDCVKLALTEGTLPADDGSCALLVDLDMVWEAATPEGGLAVEAIMATVDRLHDLEGAAFEAAITDAARELFDAA